MERNNFLRIISRNSDGGFKLFHVNLAKRIYFRTVLPGRYGKNGHRAQLPVAEECNHAEGNV